MKKIITGFTTLILGALLAFSSAQAGESVFETVMDKTISSTTAGKVVNLQGYGEFALLARFEGGAANANKDVVFEIGHNNITVVRETVRLNASGWANFSKTYAVFAPNVGLAVYNPPANLKAKITFYAAH
jgi:nucleoid DNA-binding protein